MLKKAIVAISIFSYLYVFTEIESAFATSSGAVEATQGDENNASVDQLSRSDRAISSLSSTSLNISFVCDPKSETNFVIGIYENGELSPNAKKLDKNGEITKIVSRLKFNGKLCSVSSFVSSDDSLQHVVLVGLGKKEKSLSRTELQDLGATIYDTISELENCVLAIDNEDVTIAKSDDHIPTSVQSVIAFGALVKSWRFDKYKLKKDKKIKQKKLLCLTSNPSASEASFESYRNLADGLFLGREVISEPANVIYIPRKLRKKVLGT